MSCCILLSEHWYQNIISELVDNPEKFDRRPKEQVEFRAWLFDKINEIDKQIEVTPDSKRDENVIDYSIWGSLSPKTLDYIKSKKDADRQEGPTSNDNQLS